MTIKMGIDDDAANANWLHRKKKKTQESMEPFKPQDGELLQKPRTEDYPEEKSAHSVTTGKRNSPRGFADNKREKF